MTQSSISSCNSALNARNAMLDGGRTEIRTGSASDIDLAVTGTLLETIPHQPTAFNLAVGRVSSAILPSSITAVSSATVGTKHYVSYNSSGGVERNGSAGVSGADMILNIDSWSVGDTVSITSWSTSEAK